MWLVCNLWGITVSFGPRPRTVQLNPTLSISTHHCQLQNDIVNFRMTLSNSLWHYQLRNGVAKFNITLRNLVRHCQLRPEFGKAASQQMKSPCRCTYRQCIRLTKNHRQEDRYQYPIDLTTADRFFAEVMGPISKPITHCVIIRESDFDVPL